MRSHTMYFYRLLCKLADLEFDRGEIGYCTRKKEFFYWPDVMSGI